MNNDIIFTEAKISKLALHRVGNKSRQEGIFPSKKLLQLKDDGFKTDLQKFFLSHFKTDIFYHFGHSVELSMNELFNYCSHIFEDPYSTELFYEESVNMLRQLYECSDHNKINDGELYVAHFEDIVLNDELVDAIGIFKVETRDKFLKLRLDEDNDWELYFDEGTNIENLDKGCLIFNTSAEEGYRIVSVDMKGGDAKYWRDDFLMLTQLHDDNFYTKSYLNLCKQFGKTQFEADEKQDQISFLNKSIEYFNSHEAFDFEELAGDLFEDNSDRKEQFKEYKGRFQEKEGLLPEEENFFIAAPLVKKAEKSFRKIIQLDSSVEIKINSSSVHEDGTVERGYDAEKGMHYYKIYFNDEK